jgi:mono-ADP-ribosyltransferase sirtuin 6
MDLHGLSSAEELAEALSCSETYTTLRPTVTHAALAQLHSRGLLQHVITQNCDGLHRRSGIPRGALCTLHGDVFVEACEACGHEYERPYCVDVYSTDCRREPWFERCTACSWGHYTGRRCDRRAGAAAAACGGKLRDTIVNFGDDLHAAVLGGLPRAQAECRAADLVICLGSSLTVTPACDLPKLRRKGARIVIVNLQETPLDGHAAVAVRAFYPCDSFFELVMRELALADGSRGSNGGAGTSHISASSSGT